MGAPGAGQVGPGCAASSTCLRGFSRLGVSNWLAVVWTHNHKLSKTEDKQNCTKQLLQVWSEPFDA